MERMYSDVKTKSWNPFDGCEGRCAYCGPSFQAQLKRQPCPDCKAYRPHFHPERLTRIPNAPRIFVVATGDISFATDEQIRLIVDAVIAHASKHPKTEYFFQSKWPSVFSRFPNMLPGGTTLVTTLETNRDEGYSKYSKAPPPSMRCHDFRHVDFPKKIVTIEPLMDFDLKAFFNMIVSLSPIAVYIGYNSKPKQVKLPEPDWPRVRSLIKALESAGIEVRPKDLRRTSCKARNSDISCAWRTESIPENDCPCEDYTP